MPHSPRRTLGMSRPLELPAAFAEAGHTWSYLAMAAPEDDFRNRNLARVLLERARGHTLLDVGCGYGLLLSLARAAGFETRGVEPDARLVELSKALFGELGVRHMRSEAWSPDGRFDTVVLSDVLPAVADDQAVLKAAIRCVAPGGRLILSAPAGPWLFGTRDAAMGYHRRYAAGPLARRIEALGLEVREARHWNALFVLPYALAYRVLRLGVEFDGLRGGNARGPLGRAAAKALDRWYGHVERRVDFGVGLSLILVADRPAVESPARREHEAQS